MTASIVPAPQPLWRNRDYLLLWVGQAVSILGAQLSQLAFPLLVLALTGSAAQAGFVAAVRSVPYLLFALPAGALETVREGYGHAEDRREPYGRGRVRTLS